MKEKMEESKELKTQKGVFVKNEVIKMEDSQKKTPKKNNEETEKKVKIHRKNAQKRYSFKRRGRKNRRYNN